MAFTDELKNNLTKDQSQLESFMKEHIHAFFASPNIYAYYQLLKEIEFKTDNAKLILAWLALLSGDNPNLVKLASNIKEEALTKEELVLFMNLKALSGVFSDIETRLEYGKKSLEVLPKDNHSFYMANAKLTYGQLLAGVERLRDAADYFYQSYQDFKINHLYFPASVSLTNALLNYTRLGEFKKVMELADQALIASSQYQSDNQKYWEVVCLPLGMCYYHRNKPSLALEYLMRAKNCIDSLNLIHMHGYIEIYLLKTLALLEKKDDIKQMVHDIEKTFQNMHYSQMHVIISIAKILSDNNSTLDTEVERLEAIYEKSPRQLPDLVEILTYLSIIGKSDVIDLDKLISIINHYRYIGDLISLQQLLVLLTDWYYRNDQTKEAKVILEEAIDLYENNQIKAPFYLFDVKFWPLLSKMDSNIKQPEASKNDLLTTRELDILKLIAKGKSNKDLADILYISVGTVKWHINHIFSKLQVKNRIEAVEKAKQLNIL